MISIIHLKSASKDDDFYEKKSIESELVETEKNDEIDFDEMKRIITKRIVHIEKSRKQKTHSKFRIK